MRRKPVRWTIADVRLAAPRAVAPKQKPARAYPTAAELAGDASWRKWLDGALRVMLVPATAVATAACGEPPTQPTVVAAPAYAITAQDGLGKPASATLPPEKVGLVHASAPLPTPPRPLHPASPGVPASPSPPIVLGDVRSVSPTPAPITPTPVPLAVPGGAG